MFGPFIDRFAAWQRAIRVRTVHAACVDLSEELDKPIPSRLVGVVALRQFVRLLSGRV